MKDTTYAEKFVILQAWIPEILEDVRKEIKQEHLKSDPRFIKKYLENKPINRLTQEDLVLGYTKALTTGEEAEPLGEFIVNRWLIQHGDIYHYFETYLNKIAEDFTQIEELTSEQAKPLIEGSVKEFGLKETYLFSIFNSVAFPKQLMEKLAKDADQERLQKREERGQQEEEMTWAQRVQQAELQVQRLSDRYEKKLVGLQKKYLNDVSALKQQIANLQRKLSAGERH